MKIHILFMLKVLISFLLLILIFNNNQVLAVSFDLRNDSSQRSCDDVEDSCDDQLKISPEQNQTIATEGQKQEEIKQSIQQDIKSDVEKKVGLLPSSRFYFLKKFWEAIRAFFSFGDRKQTYFMNLSQKRLIEAYVSIRADKMEFTDKLLLDYINLLEKINDQKLENFEATLNKNYLILQVINLDHRGELNKMDRSFSLTLYLIEKADENKIDKEYQDQIEGQVVEKYSDALVMQWQSKRVYVTGLYNANYINTSGEETNQNQNDIKNNLIIIVSPINIEIRYINSGQNSSKDQVRVGIDFEAQIKADKIIIKEQNESS